MVHVWTVGAGWLFPLMDAVGQRHLACRGEVFFFLLSNDKTRSYGRGRIVGPVRRGEGDVKVLTKSLNYVCSSP